MKTFLLPILIVHLIFGLEVQLENSSQGDFYAYVANISVGTPPQQLSVVFDTTVSALWIPISTCPKESCEKKSTFDPKKSRTFRENFGYERVPFQGGYIAAGCRSDYISMKELEPANLTHQGVIFGLADHFPSSYKDFAYDGVFGLGPATEGRILESPLQELISRSRARDYTFTTLKISRPASHKTPDQNKSSIIVGSYYDHCDYARPLHTQKKSPEGWEFEVNLFGVGDRSIGGRWKGGLDINTDSIHLPSRVLKFVVKQLDAKDVEGKLIVPCTVNSTVKIEIERTSYRIPIDDLLEVTADKQCILKIKESKIENGWEYRIGTPFLYNRCAVLDHRYLEYRSIGFPAKRIKRN